MGAGWAAPRTATSETGASAVQRRVQAGASVRRTAALAAPTGRPRASRAERGEEVSARAKAFRGRRSARDARPTPAARRHARARARSQCGRPLRRGHRRWPRGSCLAARTHWRAMPNAPGWCEPRGGCSPAARHGLEIGHKLASGAASGRIGRCPPGQPCAAWPSSRARRTQKAEKIAAPRGVRARAGEGRCPRAVRRSRDDPVCCTAASDAQR